MMMMMTLCSVPLRDYSKVPDRRIVSWERSPCLRGAATHYQIIGAPRFDTILART